MVNVCAKAQITCPIQSNDIINKGKEDNQITGENDWISSSNRDKTPCANDPNKSTR